MNTMSVNSQLLRQIPKVDDLLRLPQLSELDCPHPVLTEAVRETIEQLRQQIEKPCQETEKGFGLANVNERIHMYFGPEYGMKIQSQKGKGTTVEIVIPAILEAPVEKTGNDTAKAVDVSNSVNSDANKKIENNPKQQNDNKIIEGGQPQQEETGV